MQIFFSCAFFFALPTDFRRAAAMTVCAAGSAAWAFLLPVCGGGARLDAGGRAQHCESLASSGLHQGWPRTCPAYLDHSLKLSFLLWLCSTTS